jgi:hypothetical protein
VNQFAALRTVASSFMVDTCTIATPSTTEFDDGSYTDTPGEAVYSGRCRIRPIGSDQVVQAGEAPVSLRLFDVWLPYDTVGVEKDHLLTVTVSDDPYMVGRVFRVTDVQGGSDGAHRKLQVEDTLTVTAEIEEAGS